MSAGNPEQEHGHTEPHDGADDAGHDHDELNVEAALGQLDQFEENTASPVGAGAIEAMQAEMAQMREQLLRAVAEAENTRKRAAREREDASKYAVSNFARDMLSVADNLRRALDAVPDELKGDARISGLTEGIEATERELLRSFEKNGIAKVEPVDEPFDPNIHEVMFEAAGTGKPAGTVIQVIQTGYVLNGRLLRPARVGVAKDEGQGGGATQPPSSGSTIDTEI